MKFFMPTRLFQEPDCVMAHRGEMAALGSCALIVTGKHSAKANGSYDDVCRALDAEKIAHVLFDEVEQNPSIETVMKAMDFGVENGVDFVIGIGGGSPLDAAKAAAIPQNSAAPEIDSEVGSPWVTSKNVPISEVAMAAKTKRPGRALRTMANQATIMVGDRNCKMVAVAALDFSIASRKVS